jgi:predicted nuclease of predicted toxin-antitoxin system
VRFLLDENLSPRICGLLVDAGHEAVHVRDLGMSGASDPDVLARAAADGLVLVTADRGDFGRELVGSQATEPPQSCATQLRSAESALPAFVNSGTARSMSWSVMRPAGPETEIARRDCVSGMATATQRTPVSCSPSSMA